MAITFGHALRISLAILQIAIVDYAVGELGIAANQSRIEANTFMMLIQKTGLWVLIFTNFVPLLIVTIFESVKYQLFACLGFGVQTSDKAQKYPSSRSTYFHKELGQIDYIFADKTGTLTKNELLLKSFSTKSACYCLADCEKVDGIKGMASFDRSELDRTLGDVDSQGHKEVEDVLMFLALNHLAILDKATNKP